MARDKADVAKRVVDAYNRRDVEALFAERVTPDFEWYPALVRALDGGVYGRTRRRRTVRRRHERELGGAPKRRCGISRSRRSGVLLGRLRGRGKGSGAPVDQPYAGIFDFRGDRIWRYRVYFDHTQGLRAAGLSA